MASVTIEHVTFNNFSFKYVVGYDLITYKMEGDHEFLYCDPTVSNREIVEVVRHRNEGLEHLLGKIQRWSCSTQTVIIMDSH